VPFFGICRDRSSDRLFGFAVVERYDSSCHLPYFSPLPLHRSLRIVAVVEALRTHAHLGHAGADPGIHKLVIGQTPYPNLCRVRGQRITISTP
jgi:hypothetical protein